MKSFYLSIPTQPSNYTNASINNLEIVSFSLLLFLGLPLMVSLFRHRQFDRAKKIKAQRQMLEKIWRSKSGKPRV